MNNDDLFEVVINSLVDALPEASLRQRATVAGTVTDAVDAYVKSCIDEAAKSLRGSVAAKKRWATKAPAPTDGSPGVVTAGEPVAAPKRTRKLKVLATAAPEPAPEPQVPLPLPEPLPAVPPPPPMPGTETAPTPFG